MTDLEANKPTKTNANTREHTGVIGGATMTTKLTIVYSIAAGTRDWVETMNLLITYSLTDAYTFSVTFSRIDFSFSTYCYTYLCIHSFIFTCIL